MAKPRRMVLSDLMSSPVLTAEASDTLADAATRMHEQHVASVVVLEDERPCGILTERDLMKAAAAGTAPTATVGEWMTANVLTLPPEATWNDASDLMSTNGFRHVPVVDGEQLVGLVSLRDLMKVAYLIAMESRPLEGSIDAPPGLEGVAVARTSVGDVLGQQGFYHYRGYNAIDIAKQGTVEDAWYLMHEGDLPTPEQGGAFFARTVEARRLPPKLAAILPSIAGLGSASALDSLRTAISAAGQLIGCRAWNDQDLETTRDQVFRLAAMTPVIAASLYRLRNGLEPIEPRDDLGYAANYLYMVNGKEPDAPELVGVQTYLVLTIDHGFNNSTFTGRVITSSGADVGSAFAGAIGALSGPFHGGAPARVLAMLEEIGSPDKAENWLRDAINREVKLMGFGHRVYKTLDPRNTLLHEVAKQLESPRLAFAEKVEDTAVRLLDELKPGRKLYANVEFYAGVVLEEAGLPREMYTPTFACSRTIGWSANFIEQVADNRIFRPLAHYDGPTPPRELPSWWPG